MARALIIQNTNFHFETALAAYYSVIHSGYDAFLNRRHADPDERGQADFCELYGIKMDTPGARYDLGVIVSFYPDDQYGIYRRLRDILDRCGMIICISHRVEVLDDLPSYYGECSVVALTPLGARLGMQTFWQFENPVMPEYRPPSTSNVFCAVQGNFWQGARDLNLFRRFDPAFSGLKISLIGNGCVDGCTGPNFKYVQAPSEVEFYSAINKNSYIIACIDPETRGRAYARERFSSNFSLSLSLEKPLFCHEFFRDLYEVPGIYYNNRNFNEMVYRMLDADIKEYDAYVQLIRERKRHLREVNRKLLNGFCNF